MQYVQLDHDLLFNKEALIVCEGYICLKGERVKLDFLLHIAQS